MLSPISFLVLLSIGPYIIRYVYYTTCAVGMRADMAAKVTKNARNVLVTAKLLALDVAINLGICL